MGVKFSQLPVAAEVVADDYFAVLDTSDSILKRTTANHAVGTTAFGMGNTTNFGHVKLSDAFATTVGGAADGVGASQSALNAAYEDAMAFATTAAPGRAMPDNNTLSVGAEGVLSVNSNVVNATTLTAEYEETSALNPHSIGDLIFLNSLLYRCTTAVASGDILVVGTNIELATDILAGTPVYLIGLPGEEPGPTPTPLAPGDVTNITTSSTTNSITIAWTDPTIGEGLGVWAGTALMMKTDSYPTSISDGTLLVDSTTRDQYSVTGYTVSNLEAGTTYYFRLIPYSTEAAYNLNDTNRVSVTTSTLAIVDWATGTDAEIVAMVEAADRGEINLSDYWNVGDERTVHLNAMSATGVGESHAAQDVTFVLMNAGGKTLTTATESGRTTCSFIAGLKNCLNEKGYMNSTNTNNGSWSSSARRTWCNSVFKNALPSTLLPIFKQFQTVTAQTYNGSTNQTTDDYFALPAAAEVFKGDSQYGQGGSAGQQTAYSNLTEFNALSRFTYYETTANRVKTVNGTANSWWERSPIYSASQDFCHVTSGGSATIDLASTAIGLAPFGCL